MKKFITILISLLFWEGTFTQIVAKKSDLIPYDLLCENLKRPLGIDSTTPHFSWKNESTKTGTSQSAYEIQVASDSLELTKGHADLWATGKTLSANQVMIAYKGKPLQERQLCYWRVRTWDKKNRCSEWSDIEPFAIGILHGMKGEYIGMDEQYGDITTPVFKKDIVLSNHPEKVFAHVNSLGYHNLLVNGKKVGNIPLQPAISQLDRHSLIVTYDITHYLKEGENTISVETGRGWYRTTTFGAQYEGPLVKVEINQLTQGTWKNIASTDGSWLAASSPYTYTGNWRPLRFGGEKYDAGFTCSWHPAKVVEVKDMKATPQLFEGNRYGEELRYQAIIEKTDSSIVLDFGRNVTGQLTIDFAGLKKGQEVKIDYTDYIPRGESFKPQEKEDPGDIYIACGKEKENFSNKFHTHTFRYVKVTTPSVTNAKALPITGLDTEEASTFSCSDERLNKVHDLIHYTMQCLTFSGYMVDCPHLERMGYGGDGNSSTMTLQTMYNVAPTYMNWITAWSDVMDEEGSIPHVAPAGEGGGGPYWCGFIIKAPWRTYLNYADIRPLERFYQNMKLWLSYVEKYSVNNLLQPWPNTKNRFWFLGDWLAPKGVDIEGESVMLSNNCFISDCLKDMVSIATILNHKEDALAFEQKRNAMNKSIHQTYYHPESHTYGNGTPLDMSYAMLAGVVPDDLYKTVADKLVSDSYGKYNTHIATGLFGIPVFTEWTVENKKTDLMAEILRQPDYPGYLYMIANDATATWESWDGERSRVHNCYNGIGTWFYQALAGIKPDPLSPGYQHFFIEPQQTKELDWVKASKPTPYGDIKVEVRYSKGNAEMDIMVPVGTTATVCIPAKAENTTIYDWKKKASSVAGNTYKGYSNGCKIYEVGSGHHHFSTVPVKLNR